MAQISQSTASCGSIHTAHVYSGVDVEKEESILKKEVKICMPYYKIAYSIAFVVILSAIQPVVYANDVGRILRTFKIKKNVEVTDNGKIII